jgi:transcriptional regulator with XRE-family HTH domain
MKLKWIRKNRGISQRELAEKSGATQQQIALIENGRSDPRLSTLNKISTALGIDLKDLFFNKIEFITTLNKLIMEKELSENLTLKKLNFMISEYGIDPYEPFWEEVYWDKHEKLIKSRRSNE